MTLPTFCVCNVVPCNFCTTTKKTSFCLVNAGWWSCDNTERFNTMMSHKFLIQAFAEHEKKIFLYSFLYKARKVLFIVFISIPTHCWHIYRVELKMVFSFFLRTLLCQSAKRNLSLLLSLSLSLSCRVPINDVTRRWVSRMK